MENKLNKKYQYGWYGTCDQDCTAKYLDEFTDRNYVESIVRVSWDGNSFEKFTSYNKDRHEWVNNLPDNKTFDDYINPEFKHLECGMGYLVVRNSDNLDKVPVIDGLVIADYDGSSGGFVAVNGCPEPTPTPTPNAPYINALSAIPDYDYTGNDFQLGFGEVVVTLKVNIVYSTKWQYTLDGVNWTQILEDNTGLAKTEWKFKTEPGTYTITVHALNDNGTLGRGPDSRDTIQLQVDAPTPTPTQTPTQTPTPTPEPLPTPTPVDCSCIPDGDTSVFIENSGTFTSGGDTYSGFEVGTELGFNPDGFTSGVSSFASFSLETGETVGVIAFSGRALGNNIFNVRIPSTRLCYVGESNSSNQIGSSHNIVLKPAEVKPGCEPTPTPEPEDCCHGMTQSTNVTDSIELKNWVSGEAIDTSGTLCWNEFTTKASVGSNYTVSFVDESFSFGGLSINVQGEMNSTNNSFKFTTTSGICYEGKLSDPNNINVFARRN